MEKKKVAVRRAGVPRSGETFTFKRRKWVALGIEQGGLLAISANILPGKKAFDENRKNDWREASVRKYLNGEYLEKLGGPDGLLKFTSDLISDDGMKDYGTSEDYVFLLSCDLYRKYRDFIPKYDNWYWTLTPWSCNPSNANYVRNVYTSGALNDYYAYNALGLAPSLLINLESFGRRKAPAAAGRGDEQEGKE